MPGSLLPIRVSYVIELEDHQAVTRASRTDEGLKALGRKRTFATLAGTLLISLVVMAILGRLMGISWGWLDWRFLVSVLYVTLIFHLAFLASVYVMAKWTARRLFFLTYGADKSVTHEISENGITSESRTSRGTCGWPDIRHYEATSEHLLLFIGPMEAYVFPHRAFESETDFQAAVAFVKEKMSGKAL